MANPSWMLVRVMLETRTHHARADEDRLVLLDRRTTAGYRAALARIYGFEAPYEAALAGSHLPRELIAPRLKAEHLLADLRELGASAAYIARLRRCPIRPFHSDAEALGWLFAVERNTLLHGQLYRHAVAWIPGHAHAYLGAYVSPGARMRELGELLDAACLTTTTPDRICASAREAFRWQHQWFDARDGNEDDDDGDHALAS
jgi:heme oxygenase